MEFLLKCLNKLNISLGCWFGVPVRLHWSWVILFLFLLSYYNWIVAASYVGLFFIVLLHECGHCVAGRYFGCFIRDIVLYPFGGAAMEVSSKPKEELLIALAGPAVNVGLLPIFWILAPHHEILHNLALYNVILLCFNLLPAFPMDGGRVFRAVLELVIGNRLYATTIAVRIGQVFCVLFGVIGLLVPAPLLLFIGFLIFSEAEQELQQVKTENVTKGMRKFFGIEIRTPEDVEESAQILRAMQQRQPRSQDREE